MRERLKWVAAKRLVEIEDSGERVAIDARVARHPIYPIGICHVRRGYWLVLQVETGLAVTMPCLSEREARDVLFHLVQRSSPSEWCFTARLPKALEPVCRSAVDLVRLHASARRAAHAPV